MTPEERALARDTFRQKNLLRRTNHTRSAERQRILRRIYEGKFGNLPPEEWNELILGTTGEPRTGSTKSKRDKD